MEFPYSDFNIFQLPKYASSVNFDNELILIDNLTPECELYNDRFLDYPVKLSFSISIICISGSMSFRINLNEHTLRAGDMLVCQRGDFGEFLAMEEGSKVIIIAFSDEYFQNIQYAGAINSMQRLFRDNPTCHLTPSATDECVTIYNAMKTKIREEDNPYRKGALMGYIQVLLYDAYYYFNKISGNTNLKNKKSTRKEEIFEKFIKAVHDEYREHRSISHYADVLCISPKYLSQIVMQASGRLAGEWIADYVILEAKAMLKSKKFTVQQVSDFLNFSNQSFFGRYFKEKVGCSPTAYQKQE